MSITLLAGPINSGKTTQLLNALRGRLASQRGVFVVPTETTADEMRRHMLSTNSAIIGDAFTSWKKFVRLLADPDGPMLSASQASPIILGFLRSHPLQYFKSKSPSTGITGHGANVAKLPVFGRFSGAANRSVSQRICQRA